MSLRKYGKLTLHDKWLLKSDIRILRKYGYKKPTFFLSDGNSQTYSLKWINFEKEDNNFGICAFSWKGLILTLRQFVDGLEMGYNLTNKTEI